MASIFLGLDDPELTIPKSDALARASAALFDSKSLVLHTNIGDITATFDREHASETVIQVARYALAGVLDETHLMGQKNGVAVVMPSQKAGPNMQPFHAEGGVARRAGTVSYCLAGGHYAQPTIIIDTVDSIPADTLCIGFARVTGGMDLVAAFQPGTSATLAKAETISGVADSKKIAAK
jgi:cyclophilin family peptidyl-prolyl cis-trans isomerase